MHTNKTLTSGKGNPHASAAARIEAARRFRRWAKGELASHGRTVTDLATSIGKSRNAVSRAINRGEFRNVQEAIRRELA
jgi:hypothetical protein